ncbi:hypothetical protein D3C83_219970 [compost metagenome]
MSANLCGLRGRKIGDLTKQSPPFLKQKLYFVIAGRCKLPLKLAHQARHHGMADFGLVAEVFDQIARGDSAAL